jgi:hypothetical protein
MPFDFSPLAPMDVQEVTRPVRQDTLFYAATGNFTNASGAAVNVFTQIYHIHNGRQLPMFSKPAPMTNAFGTGQRPQVITPTYLVPAGDSFMVEVRSTDRANALSVEACLFGTAVNRRTLSSLQKIVLDQKRKTLDSLDPDNKDVVGDQPPAGAAPFVQGPVLTVYPLPGAAAVSLFDYIVPPGQRTRIFEHALQHVGGNPPELSGTGVIWRFLVDGWPLKGLGAQTAQIGTFATPDRVVIWLKENQHFQVTVEVPAGANPQPGSCGYRANGWTAGQQIRGTQ